MRLAAKSSKGLYMIERNKYLNILTGLKENGRIKVLSGIKGCGKYYLLFKIYHKHLNSIGVDDAHIIELALDDMNSLYRDPSKIEEFIRKQITDDKKVFYVFISDINIIKDVYNYNLNSFFIALQNLMKIKNVDIYITGTNEKGIINTILANFVGKIDEIRVYPLSFSEYYSYCKGDKHKALQKFFTYGGLPETINIGGIKEMVKHCRNMLYNEVLPDINKLYYVCRASDEILDRRISIFKALHKVVLLSIGSFTSPLNLSKMITAEMCVTATDDTVAKYLNILVETQMLYKVSRYSIKKQKYIASPLKYYFADIASNRFIHDFREINDSQIMENIIFNELIYRGYNVDTGVVEYNHKDSCGKKIRSELEINFIASKNGEKIYIQSTLDISDDVVLNQIIEPLKRANNSFKKIVVVKDNTTFRQDNNGIFFIGLEQFLLNEF